MGWGKANNLELIRTESSSANGKVLATENCGLTSYELFLILICIYFELELS